MKEKVELIRRVEAGESQEAVARAQGVAGSKFTISINYYSYQFYYLFPILGTVNGIWRNRAVILEQFRNSNPKLRKSRKAAFENVDEALYTWFTDQRSASIPLDGTILKQKAQFFADALGIQNFSASNGWFDGWKRRFEYLRELIFRKYLTK